MRWNHSNWLPGNSFVMFREDHGAEDANVATVRLGAMSVFESANEFTVEIDVPGLTESDLDISLNEDQLIISGERKIQADAAVRELFSDRSAGSFRRVLKLRDPVQRDGISGELRNGVLIVKLPRVPVIQPQKISIRTI
ncbi:MAG: Hsp20/alpha crystallin family protein [Planctomyces sp.]|nr:Hsp20/alpha crystallin family protein [Planctomyces sp.]